MGEYLDNGNAYFRAIDVDLDEINRQKNRGSVFVVGELIRVKDSVFSVAAVEGCQLVLQLLNHPPVVSMISSLADDEIERLVSFAEPDDPADRDDQTLSSLYSQIGHIVRQIRYLKSQRGQVIPKGASGKIKYGPQALRNRRKTDS